MDDDVFRGLAGGALPARAFSTSLEDLDKNDRIIHDRATGNLYFDRDGSGTKYDAVLFAHLDNGAKLDASDFLIVA